MTTAQHQAVLQELKARKDEARKMLQGLRVSRKNEDKRHSRLLKQAKKLDPKDLLEIAGVRGISPDELREMAERMSPVKRAPARGHADPPEHHDGQALHSGPPDQHEGNGAAQALVPLDVIPLDE